MEKAIAAGLVTVTLLVGGVRAVPAQGLAGVARQEEERRKQVKGGKSYTNKDLKPAPAPATPPAPVPASGAAQTADAKPADVKPGADSKPAADAKPAAEAKPTEARDQKYWADRMSQLRTQLTREQAYVEAMQTRVNALTTDFVNRDDPAQRALIEADRQKALDELDRLKKSILDTQKAIADLEEEARRANVPAGWLR